MDKLKVIDYSHRGIDFPVFYRENTTDFNCLNEVLNGKTYIKRFLDFDVKPGETWLDLGGNIGAFALYAYSKGAKKVISYEPDKENFKLLKKNIRTMKGYEAHNCAVTAIKKKKLEFFTGKKPTDRYRYSQNARGKSIGMVDNKYGDFLKDMKVDGVKMDIETSEFALLDNEFIPKCKKLVMEYHITKDPKFSNLFRRVDILKKHFKTVHVIKSLMAESPDHIYNGFFDQQIFCTNEM